MTKQVCEEYLDREVIATALSSGKDVMGNDMPRKEITHRFKIRDVESVLLEASIIGYDVKIEYKA